MVFVCAKAKRQQHGFRLCESLVTATTNVFCSESKAAATNVLSARKGASAAKRPVETEIHHTFW